MQDHEQERIDYLWNFVGRKDAFAMRVYSSSDKKWGYKPVKRPITVDDIGQHITPEGPHLGTYLMEPESDIVRHAAFDLDDHDDDLALNDINEVGMKLYHALISSGYSPIPFRSGGGKGIHIWLLWPEAQKASDVRFMMQSTLTTIELKAGTKGLIHGEVEIFPKQVKAGKYGNLIALPLGRASVPLDPETFEPMES